MNDKPPTPSMENERRDYFRITDKVQLRYTCVDENSALSNKIPNEFQDDIGYSLVRELELIDREHSPQLRAIAELSRDLEVYLKAINRKIELIASKLATSGSAPDHKDQQVVSLSEGGMSFRANKAIADDSCLALQLTLLPSHITLVLFGRVINCSSLESGENGPPYSVAVSFVHLREDDRQTLAKHIMQLQLAQRRQQHEE